MLRARGPDSQCRFKSCACCFCGFFLQQTPTSKCRAGVPSKSRSTWLIASPSPPLDEQIFSLQVFQSGNRPLRRRQGTSTGFLSSIGGILPSCQSAADYHLRNGALASNSLSFSTSQGVRNGEFRATQVQGPITTFFTLHGGFLEWRNAAFDGGAARFCARESQPLLVVFTGAVPEGCSSVALKAVPSRQNSCGDLSP